ncbi:Importin subunit alpha-1a [Platanthera zijinensis]|uniref:Importin subunit alpha-1a n=1 Tax=Platanthera zijinensis TaxID=2320716 RepID=A0AAP0BUF6_9ASPA
MQVQPHRSYTHASTVKKKVCSIPLIALHDLISSLFWSDLLESLLAMVSGVYSDDSALQLEATPSFVKLLLIENTKVVIDHGDVPIFVKLLGSPSDDV